MRSLYILTWPSCPWGRVFVTGRGGNIPHLGIIMSGLMGLPINSGYLSCLIHEGLLFFWQLLSFRNAGWSDGPIQCLPLGLNEGSWQALIMIDWAVQLGAANVQPTVLQIEAEFPPKCVSSTFTCHLNPAWHNACVICAISIKKSKQKSSFFPATELLH